LSDFQCKKEVKTNKKTGKTVTFIDIKNMKVIQNAPYPIRLSVITKEYKEVALAQRKVELTPRNIEDTESSSSRLWPGTAD